MSQTIVIKKVGEPYREVELDRSRIGLEYMQNLVKGSISMPFVSQGLSEQGIDVVINDEGKLLDLPWNVAMVYENKVIDVLVGNIMFCSVDDEGYSICLNDSQVEYLKNNIFDQGAFFSLKNEETNKSTMVSLHCIDI